ncbi:MAG: aspartate kinase [Candidatus Daviesbacteria bacterium]|nr:aspartate kinase [Candidatus Daviesbacteria bacterium]
MQHFICIISQSIGSIMIVAKFGGTSISSRERVLTLCNIVAAELERQPVVVVSALSGVTDLLLSLPVLSKSKLNKTIREIRNLHKNLVEQLWIDKKVQQEIIQFIDLQFKEIARLSFEENSTKEFLDKLASYGEIMSAHIITEILKSNGVNTVSVLATDLIIATDNFGSAEFLLGPTQKNIKKILAPLIKKNIVPVVTGFIASTKSGQVITLGRGGSDYTAAIIGFCLKASEIQIWTDVDGMFTTDPRFFKNAKQLPVVSFKEASELATFGARVLHPRTIKPAIVANIPVKVLNTFNPENPGTLIKEEIENLPSIRAIAFKKNINLINISSTEMLLQKGFLARVFKVFAKNNISVDLVSVSEVSISVTLDAGESLTSAAEEISKFANVSAVKGLGMVSLVGEGITASSHTIKKIFDILDKEKILIRMVSLGATDINISIVVESEKIEQAVEALHDQLLLKQA